MLKNKTGVLITAVLVLLLVANTAAFAQGSGSFYGAEDKTEIEISGEISPELRYFSAADELNENLKGDLEISYPGQKHEFNFLLDFQPGAVEEVEIDELYYKYYGEKYNILLGKDRPIWGKGDQLHVVDNLNAEDMSDFINQDYKDRQIGEEMLKIDRYFRGGNANLEFVYTPDFTPTRLAEDPESRLGDWVINPFAAQISLKNLAAATAQSEAEVIRQVKNSIAEEDNQFALRFTDSRGGTDYGFSYYHGYLREPSYDLKALNTSLANNPVEAPDNLAQIEENKQNFNQALNAADLQYDEVDVFGLELARVIRSVNSRFELAYYRTEDTAGDDPTVRNNKIAWVIGGDRDLPISNLNLNLQFKGEKILDEEEIENNLIQTQTGMQNIDLEYNQDGDYISNRAVLVLEDSYQNEKIIPQLSWVYNLNENDYFLEAALEYELKQDLILTASHKIFSGDAGTTFGQFEDNDYSAISLNYSF
ncbi:hypothetical protein C7957_12052 [Halanaerobium saccharolyticum]|jgi:hypothetical protein|uniref:Uncharacterized protein n=1 Tax=Halanaerobium saccharolyticum TaxID=43595 RepID=A0A4R6RU37_9FIRM|nr:hypothetical protein [Halanaerobium saccharolyticum]TDP90459.1 hypothetical protein C7957_12052 [Halanaerobium saccharolyticum]